MDPLRDEEWTADGLPLVHVISTSVGYDVTRMEITAAAPQFSRTSLTLPSSPEDAPVAADELSPSVGAPSAEYFGEAEELLKASADHLIEMGFDELREAKLSLDRHHEELGRIIDYIGSRVRAVASRSELVQEILDKVHGAGDPIRDYLNSSQEARVAKDVRLEKFESVLGMTKDEIEEVTAGA